MQGLGSSCCLFSGLLLQTVIACLLPDVALESGELAFAVPDLPKKKERRRKRFRERIFAGASTQGGGELGGYKLLMQQEHQQSRWFAHHFSIPAPALLLLLFFPPLSAPSSHRFATLDSLLNQTSQHNCTATQSLIQISAACFASFSKFIVILLSA